MNAFQRAAAAVNTLVRPVVASSWGRRLVGGTLTLVTYRGRRSGRIVTVPVSYTHDGDTVHIGVALPDRKSWWRNFTGEGHPITVRVDGVDRTGHAVARRDEDGPVRIAVRLDELPSSA